MQPSCRFCYSYKPPGTATTCCPPPPKMLQLSTLASLSSCVYGSSQTNSSALLQAQVEQQERERQSTITASTLAGNIARQGILQSSIQGNLIMLQAERANQYRRFQPEFIPSSVIQLEMRTANVGVPVPTFTMADCQMNKWRTLGQ
jgi:hypothetical protein